MVKKRITFVFFLILMILSFVFNPVQVNGSINDNIIEEEQEEVIIETEIVDIIPGDINGDGKVNAKDATRLFQYIAGWDVEVNELALDTNGDGKVNAKDATRLFQYIAGWDVELHATTPVHIHTMNKTNSMDPTCTNDGNIEYYTCTSCNKLYSDINGTNEISLEDTKVSAKGHEIVVENIVDATCKKDGYTSFKCENCSYKYTGNYEYAYGHKYLDWVVEIPATCESEGLEYTICEHCNERINRYIPAENHSYVLIEEKDTEEVYECKYCGREEILKSEDEELYTGEVKQLLNQENTFSFVVITANDKDYIYDNLKIYDVYFEDTEYVNNDGVIQPYKITKSDEVENGWIISPETPYEDGTTFIAELTGDLKFSEYLGNKLIFSIKAVEKVEIEFSNNIVFLNNLEEENPGYYPYYLEMSDEANFAYLYLQKVDGIEAEDILLLGDISSVEDIFAAGEEIFMGKVEIIHINENGEYVVVLSCPDLEEVFDKFDIYDVNYINFEDYPQIQEDIEQIGLSTLYNSDQFAEFIAATDETVQAYALERNLTATPLSKSNFKDKFKMEGPTVKPEGNKLKITFKGSFINEFKNADGKKVGEFSISFEIGLEFEFSVSVNYKLKKKWFIPVGVEYFDFSVTQKDKFYIDFDVKFEYDYELEQPEKEEKYYYHKKHKKIHIDDCTYEKMTNDSNIVYISAKNLHEYANMTGFTECDKCQPISHLNRAAFVVNTHKTTGGKDPYTIHCYDCWHVENQMAAENMELFYGTFNLLTYKYKLSRQEYEICSWCQPDRRATQDFEESLLQTYKYADWGKKVAEIKEWIKSTGADEYDEPAGILLWQIKYPIYVVTLNLDLRLTLSFEFEAALNYHYEQTHTNVYGMRLQSSKVTVYKENKNSESSSSLTLSGELGFEAGLRLDGYASITGLSKWVRIGLTLEAGVYIDGKGIVNITSNPNESNYAAVYFETGLYLRASFNYKVVKWSDNKTLLNKKMPLATFGYDRAYFSYTEELDTMVISDDTPLDLNTLLAVKYYDIHKEQSVDEILSLSSKLYKVKIKLKSGENCRIVNNKIVIDSDAPCRFTDEIIIEVTGNTSWKKYVKNSAAIYLDTRTVSIVYEGDGIHAYDQIEKQDPTCTENGYIYYECNLCGESKSEELQAKHTEITDKYVPATCTLIGLTEGSHCSVCNEVLVPQLEIPALGHIEVIDHYVAPECLKTGLTEGKHCSRCDEIIIAQESINALGHKLTHYEGKEASCTEHGYNAYDTCSRCDYTTYVEIPAKGHNEVIDQYIKPTCVIVGYTEGSHCSVCNEVLVPQVEIPALGHIEVIAPYVAPECLKTGLTEGKNCSRCDEKLIAQEIIKELGHNLTYYNKKDATCFEKGHEAYEECDRCDYTTYVEILASHNYVDGKCTICQELKPSDGLVYTLNSDNSSYTVSSIGTCQDSNIIIAKTHQGLPVTIIGENAFSSKSKIKSVTIPNSITIIEAYGFGYCRNLEEVIFEENSQLKIINELAFADCIKLTNFTIPSTVTKIGYSAFTSCESLTSIKLPASLTYLGSSAFYRCFSLENIEVDENNEYYKSIDGNLYRKDGEILIQYALGKTETIFEIPNTVKRIGDSSFSYSVNLVDIIIPTSIVAIEDCAMYGCSGLENIILPETITYIGASAFGWCTNLTSIEISKNVTYVGWEAFYNCTNLTIYCEVPFQPTTWHERWNNTNCPVVWDCKNEDKEEYSEGLVYILNSDNSSYTVSSIGVCNDTEIIIPNKYNGLPVTAIGESAFASYIEIEKIIIPSSVTMINSSAFNYCLGLKEVIFEENSELKVIGSNAFKECYSLENIELPNSVVNIEESAFNKCENLEKILIPSSVQKIGNSAYSWCKNLEEIIFEENSQLKTIGESAFYYCQNLTTIELPYGVTTIGASAFSVCQKLTSIELPSTVTAINNSTFSSCKGLTNVVIPSGVTSIGASAFANCTGLVSIDMGNTVTSIGSYAFQNCTSLTNIKLSNSLTTIGSYAFKECSKIKNIELPNSMTIIGDYALYNCTGLEIISIPSSVNTISNYAFYGCTNLKTVDFADNMKLTSIGSLAFYGCRSLENISIPSTVRTIGSSSFAYCNKLASVVIPNGVTIINNGTFSDCQSLKDITIPNSVTTIDKNAFYNCRSLETIVIPNSVTSIGASVFSNCYNLKNVELPNIITSLPNSMFSNCEKLESIVIPNTVKTIGTSVFSNCQSLKNIDIPTSVTSIGSGAFSNCQSLENIVIPTGVTTINSSMFSSCYNLKNIYLPNGITSIGDRVFYDCQSLTNLEIPDSVTSIGSYAFNGCINLKTIELPSSMTSIGSYAFAYFTGLETITIPNNITSISNSVFNKCTNLKEVIFEGNSQLTTIGESAFTECTNLESIIIPISVTNMKGYVFSGSNNITIYCEAESLPSGWNTNWNSNNYPVVWGYKANNEVEDSGLEFELNSDNISYSLVGLGNITDKDLVIPSTYNNLPVTNISFLTGSNATNNLLTITIPESVTMIDYMAFANCPKLESIIVSSNNKDYSSIDGVLFNKNATELISYPNGMKKSVYSMPNTVTSIAPFAFFANYNIRNIILSENLKKIESCAFNINGPFEVLIHMNVEEIASNAFVFMSPVTGGTNAYVYIYCEHNSKPNGWDPNWYISIGNNNISVQWGYTC